MARSYTEYLQLLAPSWLNGDVGGRYLYALGGLVDAVKTGALDAIRVRFVSRTPVDGLPYVAADRLIDRASSWTFDQWRSAIGSAWSTWQLAGTKQGVLDALYRAAVASWSIFEPSDWPVTGNGWAQFWAVAESHPWATGSVVGTFTVGQPGFTIGTTATIDEVSRVRRAIRVWKPAHTRCPFVLIPLSGAIVGVGLTVGSFTVGGTSAYWEP